MLPCSAVKSTRAALLLLLAAAGCGDSGRGTLALSWRLADERSCIDAGLGAVVVRGVPAPADGFACSDGLVPAAVTLEGVPLRDAAIAVEARSLAGTPLYAGTLMLDVLPAAATVTLYATAAR
jgi:hypothetical protein